MFKYGYVTINKQHVKTKEKKEEKKNIKTNFKNYPKKMIQLYK